MPTMSDAVGEDVASNEAILEVVRRHKAPVLLIHVLARVLDVGMIGRMEAHGERRMVRPPTSPGHRPPHCLA